MLNIVVSYDIVDDRKRKKLANLLKDYGVRVQYSVFEIAITKKQFNSLHKQIKGLLDESKDSVKYYRLCAVCVKQIQADGKQQDKPFHLEDYIII